MFRRDGVVDTETIEVAGFEGPRDSIPPPTVLAAVEQADLVLLTLSMRQEVAARRELILSLVDACPSSAEVVVAVCDNTLTPAHRQLIGELTERGVPCPATIADRVCNRPDGSPAPSDAVRVVTHEVGMLTLVDLPDARLLRERLGQAEEVRFVAARQFAAHRDQKLWIVNGSHLALALRARHYNHSDLRLAAHDADLLRPVQLIVEGMTAALAATHGLTVDPAWALDRERVVMELPDLTERVLRGFTRPGLAAFLERFADCVGRPAAIVKESGDSLDGFDSLARTLTAMLREGGHYTDAFDVKPGDVSEAADEAAVVAYRKALGWMPDHFVATGARELASRLRYERRQLERRGRLV